MKALREPLWWLIALFIGLLAGLPLQRAAVQSAVPGTAAAGLPAGELLGAHSRSRLAGGGVQPRGNGNRAGGWGGGHPARRRRVSSAGGDHRRYRADLSPVAVLAMAVPVLGFGWLPALIALALYAAYCRCCRGRWPGWVRYRLGCQGVAEGMGMTGWQRLYKVELPLAAPVILAGIRTSVIVNIGTATIASTVGASTLGTPIIIGLSGFNTAYIVQGALLVALAAIIVDRAFERLTRWISRHRHAQ